MHKILSRRLEQELRKREMLGNLRSLSPATNLIDFYSNDYLGFARSKRLKAMFMSELETHADFFLGSTGSRLLSGNSSYAMNLEEELASFFQAEACLLFNSGFDANLALLSCLPSRSDTLILDERVHASMLEGGRLSLARVLKFKHNDPASLRKKIHASRGSVFVAIESLYSMDGDFSPLADITSICKEEGAHLIVDEAHTTGIIGKRGEGLVGSLALSDAVFARILTFGKAFGAHGACIAGSSLLKNYLINFAKPLIYSTSSPFHMLAAIRTALRALQADDQPKKKLHQRILQYRQRLFGEGHISPVISPKSPLDTTDQVNVLDEPISPICTVLIPGNAACKEASLYLGKQGLRVPAILYPTVAKGQERLRICLHAFNTASEIDDLGSCIQKLERT